MKQNISITFLGDSFIKGYGELPCVGWVGRILKKMQTNNPDSTILSYNLGTRGDTSTQILKRYDKDVPKTLTPHAKNIIVFSFGTNDCDTIGQLQRVTYKTSVKNITELINKAKESFDEIIFVLPPIIGIDTINERIKILINHYIKQLDILGIKYINLFDILKTNDTWINDVLSNDNVHPNKEGYDVLSNIIYEHANWIK